MSSVLHEYVVFKHIFTLTWIAFRLKTTQYFLSV